MAPARVVGFVDSTAWKLSSSAVSMAYQRAFIGLVLDQQAAPCLGPCVHQNVVRLAVALHGRIDGIGEDCSEGKAPRINVGHGRQCGEDCAAGGVSVHCSLPFTFAW